MNFWNLCEVKEHLISAFASFYSLRAPDGNEEVSNPDNERKPDLSESPNAVIKTVSRCCLEPLKECRLLVFTYCTPTSKEKKRVLIFYWTITPFSDRFRRFKNS